MVDFLCCGSCYLEFPLSEFIPFIQHKQTKCTHIGKWLQCKECSKSFKTPLLLMQHIHQDHHIELVSNIPFYVNDYAQREAVVVEEGTQTEPDFVNKAVKKNETTKFIDIVGSDTEDSVAHIESPIGPAMSHRSDDTWLPFPRRKTEKKSITCILDGTETTKCCLDFDNTQKGKRKCCLELDNSQELSNDSICDEHAAGAHLESSNKITTIEEKSNCCLEPERNCSKETVCCLDPAFSILPNQQNIATELGNAIDTFEFEQNFNMTEMLQLSENNQYSHTNTKEGQLNNHFEIILPSQSISSVTFSNPTRPAHISSIEPSSKSADSTRHSRSKKTRFQCARCDQTFQQKIHLNKHIIMKHMEDADKPFRCDMCDYSTVESSHLKVHKRRHTGEKPFVCRVCGYRATQNCTLKHHYIKQHPSSRTECKLCNKSFITDRERERHERVCLKTKPT